MKSLRSPAACAFLGAALLSVLATSASAAGTTFYAAPAVHGAGDCTTANDPCLLGAALVAAGSGDTVHLDFGTYPAPSGGFVTKANVTLLGASSAATVIDGSAVMAGNRTLTITGPGGHVSDLRVDALNGDGLAFENGTSGDRVDVRASGNACIETKSPVILNNSLCLSTGTGSLGSAFVQPTPTGFTTTELNNVTLSAAETPLRLSVSGSGGTASVTNSVFYARTPAQPDCALQLPANGLTLTLDHSAYAPLANESSGCRGNTASITEIAPVAARPSLVAPIDSGTTFAAFATANYREQPESATRRAGIVKTDSESLARITDLDGRSRKSIDDTIDIGAYERFDPPTVNALPASEVSATRAVVGSTVNNHGVASSSTVTYGIGSVTDTILSAQNASPSLIGATVTDTLTDLQPGTAYLWQQCVLAGDQDTCTPVQTFTTPSLPPVTILAPTVATWSVLGVTDHGALVSGNVDIGADQAGSAHFDYGTTTAYGSSTTSSIFPATASGTRHISVPITSLIPGTSYHARLVATNGGGSTNGGDFTFRTSGVAPVTPTPTPTPTLVPGGPPIGAPKVGTFKLGAPVNSKGVITLPATVPGPGALAAKATFTVKTKHKGRTKTKKVAYGTASAAPTVAGTTKLTIKPSKAAARLLKAKRTLKLTIIVTFTAPSAKPATATATATAKP